MDKYTYEVCPFDKASQKEGAASTNLGSWQGLEEGDTRMAFRNGAHCWQGPARSMTVRAPARWGGGPGGGWPPGALAAAQLRAGCLTGRAPC